jgi:hypothetical protein
MQKVALRLLDLTGPICACPGRNNPYQCQIADSQTTSVRYTMTEATLQDRDEMLGLTRIVHFRSKALPNKAT